MKLSKQDKKMINMYTDAVIRSVKEGNDLEAISKELTDRLLDYSLDNGVLMTMIVRDELHAQGIKI